MFKVIAACLMVISALSGCSTAASHRKSVQDQEGDALTVGKVQREIKVGMSSGQVIEILGSPNVVSTDEERREVWVYDKVSTEQAYSTNDGSLFLLLGGVSGSSGARSTSQKTLTIVIKFDGDGKVRDFAYHTSRF